MKKITVVVMTYNHSKYIAKALDSILSQKIDTDFDILIHDDCSDDGTEKIIFDYQKKYPSCIKVIRQQSRRFLIDGFNLMIFKYVVPHINSQYVAYCDGDDYWCDDLKLKKQFDFMEQNSDYSMCFHNAYQLRPNGDMSSKWFIKNEGDLTMADLINDQPGISIATSSIFIKSESFVKFSNWRKEYPVEDVPMYITAAMDGRIYRFKDIMCVYRQFSDGSWSSQNKDDKSRIIKHLTNSNTAISLFDKETNYKYHGLVLKQIAGCDFRIGLLESNPDIIFSKKYKLYFKRLPSKERLSLKLKFKMPGLYNLLHKKKKDRL